MNSRPQHVFFDWFSPTALHCCDTNLVVCLTLFSLRNVQNTLRASSCKNLELLNLGAGAGALPVPIRPSSMTAVTLHEDLCDSLFLLFKHETIHQSHLVVIGHDWSHSLGPTRTTSFHL